MKKGIKKFLVKIIVIIAALGLLASSILPFLIYLK